MPKHVIGSSSDTVVSPVVGGSFPIIEMRALLVGSPSSPTISGR
jgi:hypothetical protein